MTDLTLDVQVNRTELALAELDIQDPANGYSVVKLGPGATSWRRDTVKSPWVHGETLIHAVKDVQIAPLTVRVSGSSAAQKETRLGILLDAFSQFTYSIGVAINGVAYVWYCQPADWSTGEGGELSKFHEMAHITEVEFSIPRNPVPFVGVL